jgi:phosphatidylinositol alpha-1,6-mannosyltransferase
MKILFISHSYPPLVGGIENQNYNLAKTLGEKEQIKIIANSKGKIRLPFFIPWAFLKAFFLMTTYDICLLGSGVLSPLGAALSFFHTKKKFFCIIHGLDITYSNQKGFLPTIYKKINIPSLEKMRKLFAVGNATIDEAVNAGITRKKCVFIPNGVNPDELKEAHTRKELSLLYGKNVDDKKVILRLGRFVPHKGTHWFIENVMPKLSEDIVMIAAGNRVRTSTAGDQDNFLDCEQAIIDNHLQDRVRLLPSLSHKDVKILLNTVDIVVSPNIRISGSMEGFGINVIEAGACERVVLASNLEGLSDAVHNGKNGILVEPGNAEQWIKKIEAIISNGDSFIEAFGKKIGAYIRENFTWDKIGERYLEEMKK